MKNKGFTLLELLAVIVILAVIALIATPIILNLISDSKNSSDKVSIDMYARAVEQSIAKEELTDSIPDGSYTTVDGRTLERNGKTISVDYSGKAVICKIIIKKKDILFLNDCTIGGVAVDYSYGHIEGDLDGDGFVTEKDKEILKKMIAGTEAINDKADLNGDGKVNIEDGNLIALILKTRYDINGDVIIDNNDLVLLENMIAGTEAINDKADFNGDGLVNAKDLNLLKAYFYDIDENGIVDNNDVELLNKMIAGREAINDKSDLNGDGRVNGTDANLLKAYLVTVYDINGDGSVNNDDVELLNKMIVGTEAINDKADLNADGRVNGTDANLLKAYISYING